MSADNGVYILKTPMKNSEGLEYRVAHCQAIENLDYDFDMFAKLLFEESQVFYTEKDVYVFALHFSKQFYILEYGIVQLEYNKLFPE